MKFAGEGEIWAEQQFRPTKIAPVLIAAKKRALDSIA
jgi:hypothetical protein